MATIEQLLRILSRQGIAQPRGLAGELGVSQPTLSRLLAAAGDSVCRMGRARGTRYARTRALSGLGSRLPVYRVTEAGKSEQHGVLTLLEGGRHWLEAPRGDTLFEGLPPFTVDMGPQGYVGRALGGRYPELGLPPRIVDWNEDHQLLFLARRGEDCVGNLIIGQESLDRFLASTLVPVDRSSYPELVRLWAQGQPGSSVGGEHPKFLAYTGGRHVLVKFVGDDEGAAARRWKELLICEAMALEVVREAGLEAARAHCFVEKGHCFLEVERFDRVGPRGRRGMVSLLALDNEYVARHGATRWAQVAPFLHEQGFIDADDVRRVRWLDVFGQLIGNTDRHFGNLSFLETPDGRLRLAPIYDMLPMMFAPSGTTLVARTFEPEPPSSSTLEVWPDAALHAHRYWTRLMERADLSAELRSLARACRDALDRVREQAPI
jgi:hypothetical protein